MGKGACRTIAAISLVVIVGLATAVVAYVVADQVGFAESTVHSYMTGLSLPESQLLVEGDTHLSALPGSRAQAVAGGVFALLAVVFVAGYLCGNAVGSASAPKQGRPQDSKQVVEKVVYHPVYIEKEVPVSSPSAYKDDRHYAKQNEPDAKQRSSERQANDAQEDSAPPAAPKTWASSLEVQHAKRDEPLLALATPRPDASAGWTEEDDFFQIARILEALPYSRTKMDGMLNGGEYLFFRDALRPWAESRGLRVMVKPSLREIVDVDPASLEGSKDDSAHSDYSRAWREISSKHLDFVLTDKNAHVRMVVELDGSYHDVDSEKSTLRTRFNDGFKNAVLDKVDIALARVKYPSGDEPAWTEESLREKLDPFLDEAIAAINARRGRS